MIAAFAFHTGDVGHLLNLLEWINQLGGCKNHSALLVADAATPFDLCVQAKRLAQESFKTVHCISNPKTVVGWPEGPNSLFWAAAEFVQAHHPGPWILVETDCVPTKPGWLDAIEREYIQSTAIFMGNRYGGTNTDTGMPIVAMSGIAVYPPVAAELLKREDTKPWDMTNRELLLKEGHPTQLIQHFYGERNLPPTFVETKTADAPRNTFTLNNLKPETVLFHRCKDGSLIELLRKKYGTRKSSNLNVVFNVCQSDYQLMLNNFTWLAELNEDSVHDAFLACDSSISESNRNTLLSAGRKAFTKLKEFRYPNPKVVKWPNAPNHAFQCVARHMRMLGKPWLWMEPDAWALHRDWLDVIEREYKLAGKPVMGPVVPSMGHVNGVAVYPANFCDISPRAMNCTNLAWDAVSAHDLKGKIKDASHIFQHAWGMDGERFTNWGGKGSPTFPTADRLKLIKPTAKLFHRCKDATLAKQLRKLHA